MKKGRHRRFEEARALKRNQEMDFDSILESLDNEDETEIEINRNYAKQPTYPRKALRMGTEGYVIVEFDVDTDGSVLDPYVLEAVPQGTFERAAIKAIRKWVYEAPTYKGQSVKANNVQVKLSFAFAD